MRYKITLFKTINFVEKDVVIQFGGYENDGDVYLISGLDGICFELENVDYWDELTAPIEWIFVYKC